MVMSLDQIRRNWDTANSRRNDSHDRIFGALPTDTAVEGTFLVDGSGESTKTVNFPVVFIQRPSFTHGGELHLDTSPVAGSFPFVSCTIRRWITDPPLTGTAVDYSKMYFIGAELLILTTGPTTQRMWIHWRASGRALTNPDKDGTLTTDSVI